jgi:NADPH2:quinone reductase
MKALVLKHYEQKKPSKDDFPMDPNAPLADFALEDRPEPVAAKGKTVVRMKAAAINPMDLRVQAGLFPYAKPAPMVLGNEGAGVVEKSDKFAPGARVMVMGFPLGVSEDGTHQEMVCVPDEWVYPLPDAYSFEEGASFLIPYATAQLGVESSRAKAGDWVLVTGAAGGIGTALIQLLKSIGAKPIAMVSSAEKAERVKLEEPAGIIDTSSESVDAGVKRIVGGFELSAIIDVIGGDKLGRMLGLLGRNGVLVCLGYLQGKMATIVIPFLVGWCRSIVGSDLYERPKEESQPAIDKVVQLMAQGKVRPRIDSTWALSDYKEAFARVGSRKATGRVVFKLG